MKSFKNFKDYVFTHLFPIYYKENDTYKDEEGKGILERFIDSCTGYICLLYTSPSPRDS